MKLLTTVSLIAIELFAAIPALACIQFPGTYHCNSITSERTYDITLNLDPLASIPTYTISKITSDKAETYTLPTDGTEIQFDASANHALYRSASCTETSLQVNMREIASVQNGAAVTGKVTEVYQLTTDGKFLLVDLTATISAGGGQPATSQETDLCIHKH